VDCQSGGLGLGSDNPTLLEVGNESENRYTVFVKVRDVIRLIEDDGWYLVVTKGSHHQYKHPIKAGRVTIAGHPNDDLAPGTLNSVLKQAQLKKGQ
jgi:predicted RNA binding protein YcfA (HicA-like mRNA interferase family)